jgi:hypothetical protein
MKTVVVAMCLLLVLAVPALAEVSPAEKEALFTPAAQPPEGPRSTAGLEMPPVAGPLPWLPRTCTAEWYCGDVTVMCTGNSTCTVNWYAGGVICDGVETPCPNRCQATRGCKCGTIECWSHDGDCSSGCCPGFVNCDGDIFTCTEACS